MPVHHNMSLCVQAKSELAKGEEDDDAEVRYVLLIHVLLIHVLQWN